MGPKASLSPTIKHVRMSMERRKESFAARSENLRTNYRGSGAAPGTCRTNPISSIVTLPSIVVNVSIRSTSGAPQPPHSLSTSLRILLLRLVDTRYALPASSCSYTSETTCRRQCLPKLQFDGAAAGRGRAHSRWQEGFDRGWLSINSSL